ncbi:MAG: hypothetical protein ACYDGY_07045 [Acidimicrobiales bacterium]
MSAMHGRCNIATVGHLVTLAHARSYRLMPAHTGSCPLIPAHARWYWAMSVCPAVSATIEHGS